MDKQDYRHYVKIVQGQEKAELVLKNARIINVFTAEVIPGDLAVQDGLIVGIGSYFGRREVDVGGKYICPGFIDSHLHLESTLVTPPELIAQAARCGTTTFIVDPHESANVSGLAGIDYILDQTARVPANVYVCLPSCVPATAIDDNAVTLTAEMMAPYRDDPRVLGLGEVMDYYAVIAGEPEMRRKLDLFRNKVIDGHAPGLSAEQLQAYVLAGVATDHEAADYAYAMQERRLGLTVHIREGSAAKNLAAIVSGIVKNRTPTAGFCFCTDDKHIEDIQREGHIDANVRQAIALGLSPLAAIQMATINAARCYRLDHLGALAPGYQADFLILDELDTVAVSAVYHRGRPITVDAPIKPQPCPPALQNTVKVADFSRARLDLPVCDHYPVIAMQPGQITTRYESLHMAPGERWQDHRELRKIAVVERHKLTGKVGVGLIRGFAITDGAIASSVSHDSHNLIVVGSDDEAMELAIRELIRTQGGYTIVSGGAVYETLALPVMGLMTDAGYTQVEAKLARMIKKAHQMGVPAGTDPFITLSFMALPVIPEIRITPRGVYLVDERKFAG